MPPETPEKGWLPRQAESVRKDMEQVPQWLRTDRETPDPLRALRSLIVEMTKEAVEWRGWHPINGRVARRLDYYAARLKELDAALVASARSPQGEHEHRFRAYEVCTECGKTEAAIAGCHHCNEVTVGKRCWWCLRVRAAPPVLPTQGKEGARHE